MALVSESDPNIPIEKIYRSCLKLFKDKTRFTQGDYQKDKEGKMCPWRDGHSFCALGAVHFFSEGYSYRADCCLQRVSQYLYNDTYIQFVNDEPDGYKKVLKALEFAAKLWKDREPTESELSMSIPDLLKSRNG